MTGTFLSLRAVWAEINISEQPMAQLGHYTESIMKQSGKVDSQLGPAPLLIKAVKAYRRVAARYREQLDVDAKIDALLVESRV